METKGISRRGFLKGAVASAASITALGALSGCKTNGADTTGATSTDTVPTPSETMSTDIVVVGAGSSGICATVQAAQLGAQVVCLEKNAMLGGNGRGTEGMFAVGTEMQKEKGIEIAFREVISTEQEFFNYRPNALFWKDMVENSAENLQWLIDCGVQFSGVVDNYYGLGKIEAFHWFFDGKGDNYIEPMVQKAEELGATIMSETPATDLVIDESGMVAGVYATKKDGTVLRIDAKAVILASGGYANSSDTMMERGYDLTYSINQGIPGHDGDGLRMATAAGAKDVSRERCFLREPYSYGIDFFQPMSQTIHRGGPFLWVNDDAERYCNENCGAITPGCNSNAVHTQLQSFLIFDHALLTTLAENVADLEADVEDAVALCPGENVYKSETIEELAESAGLDPAALKATIDRYNELCLKGLDEDFNKPAEKMIALYTAPFYIFRQDLAFWTSIGGINTSRNMEVVTDLGEPVPGLYAIGTDGCELYRETYTMNVPASCQGNNLNSGRTAAEHAVASFQWLHSSEIERVYSS